MSNINISKPITYDSYISLNLSDFQDVYLYSDGFANKICSLRSFENLYGNLFQDFQNVVFRVLPVINFKQTEKVVQFIAD
jgi:inositol 1,4,5-triphosphate receptor type 3